MKKSSLLLASLVSASFSLAFVACGSQNQSEDVHDHGAMTHHQAHSMSNGSGHVVSENNSISVLIDSYLSIKTALSKDDSNVAAKAGQKLSEAVQSLDMNAFGGSEQSDLNEMLDDVKNHGEHIAKGEIVDQREHFEDLSTTFMNLLKVVGTDRTLYHQYCPMYKNGQGGTWLSASEEVKNPLFGSQMLSCGSVTDSTTIN